MAEYLLRLNGERNGEFSADVFEIRKGFTEYEKVPVVPCACHPHEHSARSTLTERNTASRSCKEESRCDAV